MPEPEAEKAVLTAKNAFEYRDFEAVEKALDPWLHPPKIVSPKLMADARRLMGVSRHVLGDATGAKEEFAQLLLLDPRHQLDPVVIPPQVIATFEEVRLEMKDTLNRILAERGEKPLFDEAGPAKIEVRVVPSRAIALLPFGAPQFVLGESALGTALGIAQVGGMVMNAAFYYAHGLENAKGDHDAVDPRDRDAYDRYVVLTLVGAGVWIASYVISAVLAFVAIDDLQIEAETP